MAKARCTECCTALLTSIGCPLPPESSLAVHVNLCGLTFPSDSLTKLVTSLEDKFMHCFSENVLPPVVASRSGRL